MGVAPARIHMNETVHTQTSSRRLQNTETYQWSGIVVGDRKTGIPTSQQLANLSAEEQTYVSTEMGTILGDTFTVAAY